MKSIKNKKLAVLVTLAMILSMSVTSIFAIQAISVEEAVQVSSEETVIMLHSPHQGTDSEDFNNKPDENGGLDDPVVWHFVLNQLNRGQEPLMIEAEFETAGTLTVEGQPVGNGSVQHFYIGTGAHDTLIDAFVIIQGESGGRLVLSHVAFGDVEEDDEDEIVEDEDEEEIDDEEDEILEDEDEIDEQEEVLGEEEQQEEQTEEEQEQTEEEEILQLEDEEITLGTVEEEESDDEEVIVLDEEVPLGTDTLPQTGDANPIIFLLSGLMMTAIGVALKRFAF